MGGGTCREYRERHPRALFPRWRTRSEEEAARYLLLNKKTVLLSLCAARPLVPCRSSCKQT